ncbi:MAG: hypothetical protein GOP50_09960 [Candidatus Heimdallarchaeota archaeon]|nr:hypothetical protein [Candidatus Heimdallarchaeota archaeon]
MAVHSIRSNVSEKIKKFGKNQKESIKESLYAKGELPILIQILGAVIFWFFIFLILAVFLSPALKWLGVVIAVAGAFLIIQAMNILGRKFVRKDEEEDSEMATEFLEISQNSILLGEHYKRGGVVLVKNRKGKLTLTPVLLLQILSVSSGATSIFATLSPVSLQRLSLKYNCSIIDTSKYELILLKGDSKKCKKDSLALMLKLLEDSFFQGAFDIIAEFQREKRIELEYPNKSILEEVFPSYGTVIDLLDKNHVESDSERLDEFSEASELEVEARKLYESFTELDEDEISVDEEEEIEEKEPLLELKPEVSQVEKKTLNPNQQLIVKDVLLRELNFSLDSFLNAAKGYYKKGIETNLDKKFEIDTDKFLKLTHLFCEKEEIPFFYSSYSYFLKIIEFLDVELPSSADIDNFSTKLSEEYVTVTFSDDHKDKLVQFLDAKLPKTSKIKTEDKVEDESRLMSIPPPPGKSKPKAKTQEEVE